MTNEQNSRIATRLAGYEVQVSPAGKYYIVTDEGTRAMPDFEADWHEAMTTLIAVCRSRGWAWEVSSYRTSAGNFICYGNAKNQLHFVATCLLQIAEGEE